MTGSEEPATALAVDPAYRVRDNQLWYTGSAFAELVAGCRWIEVRIEGLGRRRLVHSATGRDGRRTASFRLATPHDRRWWEARRGRMVRIEVLAVSEDRVPAGALSANAGAPPPRRPSPTRLGSAAAASRSELTDQPCEPLVPVVRGTPTLFDAYLFVDRSASSQPKLGKDSIWAADWWFGEDGLLGSESVVVENPRTRRVAEDWISGRILAHQAAGRRVLVGLDFPFSYPADALARIVPGGSGRWRRLWELLAERIREDDRNRNNRFEVASALNAAIGERWFWGCPTASACADLAPTKREGYGRPPELREIERALRSSGKRPFTVWQWQWPVRKIHRTFAGPSNPRLRSASSTM